MSISKKKIGLMAVALVAVLLVGIMAAFFTDTDAETNSFTIGSVDIDLIESQYHRVNAGKGNAAGLTEPIIGGYLWAADVDLQGTEANTPDAKNSGWSGQYFSDAQIEADAETYKEEYLAV